MISIENRRLVIAHNPHSSRSSEVQKSVFDRLDAAGFSYETIEVQQAHLNDNVARLAPQIKANDIVLSAAGDGSAHAIFHTILAANQPGVELGFLAYGNFNDIPNTFNTKDSFRDPVIFLEQARTQEVWPISLYADGAKIRSAMLYATIGWTAQAAARFDDPIIRHKITHGGAGIVKSLWHVGIYYFRSRAGALLPSFRIDDQPPSKATDIIVANGPIVARLFRTGRAYYSETIYMVRAVDARSVIKNIPFLLSGLAGRMKGKEEVQTSIVFEQPSHLVAQCDGEVFELENVTQLEIKKAETPLVVLTTK